jgi:integrase
MVKKRGNGEGSITRLGDGRWQGRCTVTKVNGQKKRVAVYGKTKAEARVKLTKKMAEGDEGLLFDGDNQTVEEYITRWLADSVKGNVSHRTYHNYKLQVREHIVPTLGKEKLHRLSPQSIQRLYSAKLEGGLSPASVRYIHAVLHRSLKQAAKWQLIAYNPAESVDPPKIRQEEITPLDHDQASAFLHAARGDRFECLYILSLTTGLRQGEALGLKWSDIDYTGQTLRISRQLQRQRDGGGLVFTEPKNSSRRNIDLSEQTIEALKSHHKRQSEEKSYATFYEDNDLIFANYAGRPLDAQNVVNRSFKPLLRRAGLPNIRFHDLRHSCATLLLLRGVDIYRVQHLLGHATIAMTVDRYSHWIPSMGRKAANEMDELFG